MTTDIIPIDLKYSARLRPSARVVAPAPARSPSKVMGRLIPALLVVGILWTGVSRVQEWATWWAREQRTFGVLTAIHDRQMRFYGANRSYASDKAQLRLALSRQEINDISLVAGWINGKPSYVAEYCLEGHCAMMTQAGQVVDAQAVVARVEGGALPELKAGGPRPLNAGRKKR